MKEGCRQCSDYKSCPLLFQFPQLSRCLNPKKRCNCAGHPSVWRTGSNRSFKILAFSSFEGFLMAPPSRCLSVHIVTHSLEIALLCAFVPCLLGFLYLCSFSIRRYRQIRVHPKGFLDSASRNHEVRERICNEY